MSLNEYCNAPLVLILEPYNDEKLNGLTHYIVSLRKENVISTLFRRLYTKVLKAIGIQRKIKPYANTDMHSTAPAVGIRITASEYAKLTNGCPEYINTCRHISPKVMTVIPGGPDA